MKQLHSSSEPKVQKFYMYTFSGDICCGSCGEPEPTTTTVTQTPTSPQTPPPGCEDTLSNCAVLTEDSYRCYAVSFFSQLPIVACVYSAQVVFYMG